MSSSKKLPSGSCSSTEPANMTGQGDESVTTQSEHTQNEAAGQQFPGLEFGSIPVQGLAVGVPRPRRQARRVPDVAAVERVGWVLVAGIAALLEVAGLAVAVPDAVASLVFSSDPIQALKEAWLLISKLANPKIVEIIQVAGTEKIVEITHCEVEAGAPKLSELPEAPGLRDEPTATRLLQVANAAGPELIVKIAKIADRNLFAILIRILGGQVLRAVERLGDKAQLNVIIQSAGEKLITEFAELIESEQLALGTEWPADVAVARATVAAPSKKRRSKKPSRYAAAISQWFQSSDSSRMPTTEDANRPGSATAHSIRTVAIQTDSGPLPFGYLPRDPPSENAENLPNPLNYFINTTADLNQPENSWVTPYRLLLELALIADDGISTGNMPFLAYHSLEILSLMVEKNQEGRAFDPEFLHSLQMAIPKLLKYTGESTIL